MYRSFEAFASIAARVVVWRRDLHGEHRAYSIAWLVCHLRDQKACTSGLFSRRATITACFTFHHASTVQLERRWQQLALQGGN